MLVPFKRGTAHFDTLQERPIIPFSLRIHWEKRRVWVVEGMLHRGESNTLPRRIFYIDEASWLILWGEGYDLSGAMVKWYLLDTGANSPPAKQGRWYCLEQNAQ
jgi:hypothetical protein